MCARILGCACVLALMCPVAIRTATSQGPTAPRLRQGALPTPTPAALGGGEVVLELEVDASGTVASVIPLRTTPPYDDVLAKAVTSWSFEPASVVVGGGRVAVPGRVLVAAVFRPPLLYAGPTAGAPPHVHALPSPRLPQAESLSIPPYPPNAVGDRVVLVEIELTARGKLRSHRVMSPVSGFDGAALEAVSAWRFTPPRDPDPPDRVFVYAVLGFRSPIAVTGSGTIERSR